MGLHARNVAAMAWATEDEIEKVVDALVKEKKVRIDRAKEILDQMREK
jgi:hydroxymethylglutaryl-CoA reductase